MDDYRKPLTVNRYWSRPKTRVYECNLRDAERFYQSSYKQYQEEKEYRQRGTRAWSVDKTDRFAHLRAGPIHRREASVQPSASSLVEGILSRTSALNEASEAESTTSNKSEAKPVPVYDPQRENASLEERLARLKRLREDLGLPSDSQSSQNTLRDSAIRTTNSTISNDVDSSYKSDRSTRLSSRTGAGAASDESSSYSFRSERSSKVNGIGDDYKSKSDRSTEEFKLTPRLERKREEYNITPKSERKSYSTREEYNITPKSERKSYSTKEDKKTDDYSFSSKSEKKADRFSKLSTTTASSSSPTRTRKVITTETLDFDDDDDASVVKMMKKLPSSQEILDRISKMELDD